MYPSMPWLWFYWLASAAGWIALSGGVWIFVRRGQPTSDRAARLRAIWIILLAALALRLFVVGVTQPQLSDDYRRYLLDAQVLIDGDSPYRLSPDERLGKTGLPLGNHPGMVTIYQPTSQWTFACLWWLSDEPFFGKLPIQTPTVFRLGLVGFDLWIIALLLLKLLRDGRSPWWAALYAWHPLAISEVAWSGHQDVVGIAYLMATLLLLDFDVADHDDAINANPRITRLRAILAGGGFALAIGVKPIVLPLALPLAWKLRRRPDLLALGVGATLVGLVALYLPFALMQGGLGRMIESARTFVAHWRFNASLHALLESALQSKGAVDAIMGAALLALLVQCARRGLDLWRTAFLYLFASLLLSSTAHPWYLLWALALLPACFNGPPAAGAWVWSLTIAWSYVALHNPDGYHVPVWLKLCEYAPVYTLGALAGRQWIRPAHQA